jgi:phenylalanyl-tRNA synthetase beta chain
MKFSYNWIQSFLPKKISIKEVSDSLTMKLFEVEKNEKIKKDYLLDISILPNRGDCFSHIGIARELAAITNQKLKELKEDKIKTKKNSFSLKILKNDCRRYVAIEMSDILIAESPAWIKERLNVCGVQPINNIVDIANYVMLETGQPLHVFDLDKISGKEIIVRNSKNKEKITTIDNKDFVLNEETLVVSDQKEPLAIAGIKGGKKAEISKNTSNILIESANFNQTKIRKSSSFLKIKTDASLRFEYGVDLGLSLLAAKRAALMIKDISKGKIVSIKDYYPIKQKEKNISVSKDKINKVLGTSLSLEEIKKPLNSLEFKIIESKENIKVTIPTRRNDMSCQEDVIEEIVRIIGYEKIKPVLPETKMLSSRIDKNLILKQKIIDLMIGSGFSEAYNRSFISEDQSNLFPFLSPLTRVENPASIEQKYLRPSLIPGLIENLKTNEKNYKDIFLFEIGKCFSGLKTKEERFFSGIASGSSFFKIKGILDSIFKKIGLDINYSQEKNSDYFLGELSMIYHSEVIGNIIIPSNNLIKKLRVNSDFSFFEVNLTKIEKIKLTEKKYKKIEKTPIAERDLSILVPIKIKYEEISNILNIFKKNILKQIEIIDVYSGKEIPENYKSIAFRFKYQSKKTLKSEEINKSQKLIIKRIEQEGWKIRK